VQRNKNLVLKSLKVTDWWFPTTDSSHTYWFTFKYYLEFILKIKTV